MHFPQVHSSQFTVHSQKKSVNRQRTTVNRKVYGFTLLETLVVMTLLAIVGGASMIFLTSILKGSNQATITAEVKQNGQIVLDSLERQIRNGQGAQKTDPNSIRIDKSDSSYLFIKCFPSTNTTNGWIGTASLPAQSPAPNPPPNSQYVSVTNNTDLVSGVDITCGTNPESLDVKVSTSGQPSVVILDFTVNQGVGAASRQDFLANAEFQTVISLRTYK